MLSVKRILISLLALLFISTVQAEPQSTKKTVELSLKKIQKNTKAAFQFTPKLKLTSPHQYTAKHFKSPFLPNESTQKSLRLLGVIISGKIKLALLQNNDGIIRVYSIGDKLPKTKAVIQKIFVRKIVINNDGVLYSLYQQTQGSKK